MNFTITKTAAEAYYLSYQIGASLLLAAACMLAGLFFARLIWGNCKPRVAKIKAKNLALQEELQKRKS